MSVLKSFQLASGLFFVVFLVSGALAMRGIELSPRTDSEPLEEIQDLLRQAQFEMKRASQELELERALAGEEEDGDNDFAVDSKQCNCSAGVVCSCCGVINDLRIREKYCIKLTYEPDKKAILVSMTLGSETLPPKEVPVSATQPSSFCGKVQKIWWLDTNCIEFYDYNLEDNSVNGCLNFIAKSFGRHVLSRKLGCFHMELRGTIQHADEVEPLYFEGDKDSVEGPEPIYP